MTSTLGTTAPYVLPPEPTLRDAIPVLSRLVRDPEFLETRVPSLLEEARRATGWYVAYRHDAPDGDYSLQIFVWPPGTATEVHDHCSWGAFCCVAGSRPRRALRAHRRRIRARSRPPEEALAAGVEQGGRDLHGAAVRGRHPPRGQPHRRAGHLGAPIRSQARGDRRARLRPFPNLRLRPDGRSMKSFTRKPTQNSSAVYA